MDVRKEELEAMKKIVDECVGIPKFTYLMQLNAPRPEGDYAAVKCLSSYNPGFDEHGVVTVNGVDMYKSTGIRILTFAILFSREGDEFIKFDNSFFRPTVRARMQQLGFAMLGKQPLDLASVTLETNWEIRQGIKIQVNVLRTDLAPVDIMADAIVSSKFVDGDKVIMNKGN